MAVSVDFSTRGDILIARASGLLDAESDEGLDREVARHCRDLGLEAVLVDLRYLEGAPPAPLESFHSGVSLEERGFTRSMKLAFLDREEFRKANEFYELVARNRGFLVAHFYTEEAALEWLAGS